MSNVDALAVNSNKQHMCTYAN